MPIIKYTEPSPASEFRQGEILDRFVEHRPGYPTDQGNTNASIPVESLTHGRVVVLTQDCDLVGDFRQRSVSTEEHYNILQHLLLCDLFEETEIRGNIHSLGGKEWKRIRQNQDLKYHRLQGGPIGDGNLGELPDLYLDFKRIFSVPTENLYQAVRSENLRRVAVVPAPFLQDLMQRFHAFHSRVALPEEE